MGCLVGILVVECGTLVVGVCDGDYTQREARILLQLSLNLHPAETMEPHPLAAEHNQLENRDGRACDDGGGRFHAATAGRAGPGFAFFRVATSNFSTRPLASSTFEQRGSSPSGAPFTKSELP